jgi:hypothetical protein
LTAQPGFGRGKNTLGRFSNIVEALICLAHEPNVKKILDYVKRIRGSQKSIYDPIEVGCDLWIPSLELEQILDAGMRGLDLRGLPIRTRSKVIKTRVCEVLGYRPMQTRDVRV